MCSGLFVCCRACSGSQYPTSLPFPVAVMRCPDKATEEGSISLARDPRLWSMVVGMSQWREHEVTQWAEGMALHLFDNQDKASHCVKKKIIKRNQEGTCVLQENKFWTPAQIPTGKQHFGVHEYACHSCVTWLDVTCQVGIEGLAAADMSLWTG